MSDTGGPAFPRTGVGNAGVSFDVPPQDGMTLLDYFAAHALAALLSNHNFVWELAADHTPEENVARRAFCVAEAMLAERSRRNGGAT